MLLITKENLTRAKNHCNNSNGDGNNDLFHNRCFLFDIYMMKGALVILSQEYFINGNTKCSCQ